MKAEAGDVIETGRLVLRPVAFDDAPRVHALAGAWDVARMLADMPYPMTLDLARIWTRTAVGDKSYAITLDGTMIGGLSLCALDADAPAKAELGFWLGKPWWGHGYAREAGAAAIARRRGRDAAASFSSGHFVDNPASGRVLEVLGFAKVGVTRQWCEARRETVPAIRFDLPALSCHRSS